jgi:putative integral membrane protein (TIGR02587 family)
MARQSSALMSAPANLDYLGSLARAAGGALLFAFPLLMTMEMWWLGHSMERWRMLVFIGSAIPMLLGLSYFAGFEPTFRLLDEVLDALAAYAVGMAVALVSLSLLGQIGAGMTLSEVIGKLAVCAVPASIGALVAGKQFGGREGDGGQRQKEHVGYLGRLFLMSVGAIFLAFSVAPTEEMSLIAYMMSPWHGLLLAAATILLLHGFVFTLGFPGQSERRGDHGLVRTLLTFTLPGYAIALLISLYCLWAFGRLQGTSLQEIAQMTVVLAFPAGLGAATARLVI